VSRFLIGYGADEAAVGGGNHFKKAVRSGS
jgi:hypothetical protein